MKNIDKYRGCLIGGAAGDALGYAVEFLDDSAIFSRYGEKGITEYTLRNGVAEISDDTQMTLFTATGLLLGTTRGMTRGIMGTYPSYINFSYKDWYRTQTEHYPLPEEYHYSWLVNLPEMFSRRAPGNTCLSAIESPAYGTIEEPINRSKGCGGVMRVAPIGLYFEGKRYSIDEIDRMGAETAALTHGHSLGYIPAAALVHIIHLIAHSDEISMCDAVEDMKRAIAHQFENDKHLDEFLKLIDKAIELSKDKNIDDLEAIRELGQGSIVYQDNSGKQKLFYPDYIICVNGEIWIVETKGGFDRSGNSQDIDLYTPKKFAVLKEYLDKNGLKGGIVRNDATTDELCICMENYSDDIASDDWQVLESVLP